MTIGQRIQARRKELKMSADELAKRIGKNRATVYRYEKGEIENMPLDVLEPIANALETTQQYLMGWEKVQKNNDTQTDIVVRLRNDDYFLSVVEGINSLNPEQLASIKQMVDVLLKK